MGEDGFVGKEAELFLLPLHEALTLPGGDNNGIGLHRSTRRNWMNGMVE
jgi:hypothetical protein